MPTELLVSISCSSGLADLLKPSIRQSREGIGGLLTLEVELLQSVALSRRRDQSWDPFLMCLFHPRG